MAYREDDEFEIYAGFSEHVQDFKVSDDNKRATGRCPFHDDQRASFSVELVRGFWKCHSGCGQGNLTSFKKRLGIDNGSGIVATYDYHDETGVLLYQVVRLQPKTFRARRKDDKGQWTWTMGNTRKVLYRLPGVLVEADPVVVVEGEKDAERLHKLGVNATTSPFGAGKWQKEYSSSISGRKVIVIADNDEPGRIHMLQVAKSCHEAACRVSVVQCIDGVPDKGDVSDWLAANTETPVSALLETATPFTLEMLRVPNQVAQAVIVAKRVKSIEELAQEYSDYIDSLDQRKVVFGLPEIDKACRGAIPGDVVFLLARSKVGKSIFLQNQTRNMAMRHQASLFVSIEQPGIQVLERYAQMEMELRGELIEEAWKNKIERANMIAALRKLQPFCWTSDSGNVRIEDMSELLTESITRAGIPMSIILVDYLGFMNMEAMGTREYDQLSNTARAFKGVAKDLSIPVFVIAQTHRGIEGDDGSRPVKMTSARGSGVIEESADIVLGMYRPKMSEEVGLDYFTAAIQVVGGRKVREEEAWYRVDRRSLRMNPVSVPKDDDVIPTIEAAIHRSKGVGTKGTKSKKPRMDIDDIDSDNGVAIRIKPTDDEAAEVKGVLG